MGGLLSWSGSEPRIVNSNVSKTNDLKKNPSNVGAPDDGKAE